MSCNSPEQPHLGPYPHPAQGTHLSSALSTWSLFELCCSSVCLLTGCSVAVLLAPCCRHWFAGWLPSLTSDLSFHCRCAWLRLLGWILSCVPSMTADAPHFRGCLLFLLRYCRVRPGWWDSCPPGKDPVLIFGLLLLGRKLALSCTLPSWGDSC